MLYKIIVFLLIMSWVQLRAQQVDTVRLFPDRDNTLYNAGMQQLSNGSGDHIFAGVAGNGFVHRALIHFTLPDTIPADANITSAVLVMNRSTVAPNGNEKPIRLFKVTSDWGEGASDAPSGEGAGAEAEENDATWVYRFYDSEEWDREGGDFESRALATWESSPSTTPTWGSTEEMIADVQSWLDDPSSNFGWMLRGDENADRSSNRFDSKDNFREENWPVLTITYTSGINSVLDLIQKDCKNIKVSPNPATEYIEFSTTEEGGFNRPIEIYDSSGRKIRSFSFSEKTNKFSVSRSNISQEVLPSAIYYAILSTGS
jgi:hypothetical protein